MPTWADVEPYLPWALSAVGGISLLSALAVVAALVGWASRRFGRSTVAPVDRAQARRDRALFLAAFTAASIVYLALIVGSYEGLTDWARTTLDWADWRQNIVPLSVDGLGTAAGVLAFRAVRRRTSPYACYAMVWGATVASATINAVQGGKHGSAAAFYMSFLSVAVMAMFHLFLGQFQAGAEYVGRRYPRFGIRWLTYPIPTGLDFLCVVNHPPVEPMEMTVPNAVAHREAYRDRKRKAAEAEAERRHRQRLAAAERAAELAEARAPLGPETAAAPTPEGGPERKPVRNRKPKAEPPKGTNTATAVARIRKQRPEATQAEVAKKLGVSDRTVRTHWHANNVTPIQDAADQGVTV